MKRREFIAAGVALLVSPRRSLAQGTRRRVGFLAMDVCGADHSEKHGLRGCETTAGLMEKTSPSSIVMPPPRIACQLSPPNW